MTEATEDGEKTGEATGGETVEAGDGEEPRRLEPPGSRPRPGPLESRRDLEELTAIRHGESVANRWFAEPEAPGALPPDGSTDADIPLSPQGESQARALGRWLARCEPQRRPTLTVCSPYLRARQTWTLMAQQAAEVTPTLAPVPLLVDERLRDREMGVFELHTPSALAERAPEEARRRARVGEWAYRPPGGESLADVALRVRDFLDELNRVAAGERVLIVAHDAIVAGLRYVIEGLGAETPTGLDPVPNASVSRWTRVSARLRLTDYGDTSPSREA